MADTFERAFVWSTTSSAQDLQDTQRSWLFRTCSLVYRNSKLLCTSPYRHRHLCSSRSSALSTQSSSVSLSPPQSSWPVMEEGWNVHLPVTMLHTRSRFSSCSLGQDGWEWVPSSNSEHLILILPRLQEKRDRTRDTGWKWLKSPCMTKRKALSYISELCTVRLRHHRCQEAMKSSSVSGLESYLSVQCVLEGFYYRVVQSFSCWCLHWHKDSWKKSSTTLFCCYTTCFQ